MTQVQLGSINEIQIAFNNNDIGGGFFSGKGYVQFGFFRKESGWEALYKDANEMRVSPFTTFQKENWNENEVIDFLNKQSFTNERIKGGRIITKEGSEKIFKTIEELKTFGVLVD